MPVYQFRCNTCGESRDVLANHALAQHLEFICVRCGGGMTLAPVLAVNFLRSRTSKADRASHSREASAPAQRQGQGCGHSYHCRCAVRLTKPNPFRAEIRKAQGVVEDDQ